MLKINRIFNETLNAVHLQIAEKVDWGFIFGIVQAYLYRSFLLYSLYGVTFPEVANFLNIVNKAI
jgi:hypothetical protein